MSKTEAAIKSFNIAVANAAEELKNQITPLLKAACEKWGFNFVKDESPYSYRFTYATDYQKKKYEEALAVGNAWMMGNATQVFEALERVFKFEEGYSYYGKVPSRLANALVVRYQQEWQTAISLITALPDFRLMENV